MTFKAEGGLLIAPRGMFVVVSVDDVVREELRSGDTSIMVLVLVLGIIDDEVVTAKIVV